MGLRHDFDAEILLVGSGDDDSEAVDADMHFEALNLTGKTTLPQLANVIQSADLFVGADSGVMHLAAAVGTPVVAVFGPSNYRAWHPWSPDGRAVVVTSAPECSPCSYVGHSIGLREGCEARTCMKMVTAERVLRAAHRLLDEEPMPQKPSAQPHAFEARATQQSERVNILGIPTDNITYTEWMQRIGQWVESGTRCYHVCTTNPEFLMIAQRDANFRHILQRADLCIPDGVGLLWAARRLGQPLRERVTGSDGVPMIAEHAARNGWRLFFLGAAEGVAEHAAQILSECYAGLQVVGTYSGSPAPEEEVEIVQKVNASGADILLVAYGAPIQDKWIARNAPRLTVKMAMGVGGTFDFITGTVPRAPKWMQDVGLEWLYRLLRQPSRIGRMMRLPRFVLAVLWQGRDQ